LKWLVDEKVITMPKEAEEKLKKMFYDTAMQTLIFAQGSNLTTHLIFPRQKSLIKAAS